MVTNWYLDDEYISYTMCYKQSCYIRHFQLKCHNTKKKTQQKCINYNITNVNKYCLYYFFHTSYISHFQLVSSMKSIRMCHQCLCCNIFSWYISHFQLLQILFYDIINKFQYKDIAQNVWMFFFNHNGTTRIEP